MNEIIGKPHLALISRRQARKRGFDISEMKDIPIYCLRVPGSKLYYEQAENGFIWVLMCHTQRKFRRQGRAKLLLTTLFNMAKSARWGINWGEYTQDGLKYLQHIVEGFEKLCKTTV